MTESEVAIIFVPGIRPKPDAGIHTEHLRRCIVAGAGKAGGDEQEGAALAESFSLIGWSRSFYGMSADIALDLPGIEALLLNTGSTEQDLRDARAFGRRFIAAMYGIADRFPFLSSLFATRRMHTRVEEINRYFNDAEGEGVRIRAMLAEQLQQAWGKSQPVLLVAHSFGSVIAYDTLWELSHKYRNPGKVDLFLSLGSPLTMAYIRKRIKGVHKHGAERFPGNIRRWHNLAAVGEVTTLDRKMAACFNKMRALNLLESITDDLTLLNQFRTPEGLNVHKCYGYFASEAVGHVLLDWYRDVKAPRY